MPQINEKLKALVGSMATAIYATPESNILIFSDGTRLELTVYAVRPAFDIYWKWGWATSALPDVMKLRNYVGTNYAKEHVFETTTSGEYFTASLEYMLENFVNYTGPASK
jgi:hypothetical protein